MLKTHGRDLDYFLRCIESIRRFNQDRLPVYVVVPDNERSCFEKHTQLRNGEVVISQETFCEFPQGHDNLLGRKVDSTLAQAYASRLAFAHICEEENYFTIDSDFVFIRPFSVTDFIDQRGNPYWIAEDWHELQVEDFYYQRYWKTRSEYSVRIAEWMGHEQASPFNVHGGVIINCETMLDLHSSVLAPRDLFYADLVAMAPYEFLWYDQWVFHKDTNHGQRRSELVKYIHHQGQHLTMRILGVSEVSLSRFHIGLNLNSNWSRQYGLVDFDSFDVKQYLVQGDWVIDIESVSNLVK